MVCCNGNKLLIVVAVTLIASTVTAVPTDISGRQNVTAETLRVCRKEHTVCTDQFISPAGGFNLTDRISDVLSPHKDPAALSALSGGNLRSLPPVPAALIMGLVGFLCVSMVRDRRTWLAGLAAVLWVGQFGVTVVPRVAVTLVPKPTHRRASPKHWNTYHIRKSRRTRANNEGTAYIGLLYRLAGIPTSNIRNGKVPAFSGTYSAHFFSDRANTQPTGLRGLFTLRAPERSALIRELYLPDVVFNGRADPAEHILGFSPAFSFAELPRGPPVPASDRNV